MTEMCLHNITGNELHNTTRTILQLNLKTVERYSYSITIATILNYSLAQCHKMQYHISAYLSYIPKYQDYECKGGMFPLPERQTKFVFIFFQPSSNYIYVLHVHFLQSKTWTKLNSSNMSCNDFPSSNLCDSMVL